MAERANELFQSTARARRLLVLSTRIEEALVSTLEVSLNMSGARNPANGRALLSSCSLYYSPSRILSIRWFLAWVL